MHTRSRWGGHKTKERLIKWKTILIETCISLYCLLRSNYMEENRPAKFWMLQSVIRMYFTDNDCGKTTTVGEHVFHHWENSSIPLHLLKPAIWNGITQTLPVSYDCYSIIRQAQLGYLVCNKSVPLSGWKHQPCTPKGLLCFRESLACWRVTPKGS